MLTPTAPLSSRILSLLKAVCKEKSIIDYARHSLAKVRLPEEAG